MNHMKCGRATKPGRLTRRLPPHLTQANTSTAKMRFNSPAQSKLHRYAPVAAVLALKF
jgi:hypothetical protein